MENRAFSADVMNIETILRLPFCILNRLRPPHPIPLAFWLCAVWLCAGFLGNFSPALVQWSAAGKFRKF